MGFYPIDDDDTIRFESGKTATVKLKEERWTVKDAEMEGAEEGVPPEPEPEAWEGVLASLALRFPVWARGPTPMTC